MVFNMLDFFHAFLWIFYHEDFNKLLGFSRNLSVWDSRIQLEDALLEQVVVTLVER
jgi:hypothetical protein